MTPSKTSTWCRTCTVCSHSSCRNWIWQDKLQPGTRCRRCGTWWTTGAATTGKGKGQGHGGRAPHTTRNTTWPKKALTDSPPGLSRPKPLRKPKDQQTAAELLTATWDVIPEDIQHKLQAVGLGPQPPEEPALTDILKTHMSALPPEVQEVVIRLTEPLPQTEERHCATA